MGSLLNRYNSEIMATPCRKCGATFPSRCGGSVSTSPKPPHRERIEDAGWKWNQEEQKLERIADA